MDDKQKSPHEAGAEDGIAQWQTGQGVYRNIRGRK